MKHSDLLSDYIDRSCLAEAWGVSKRTLVRYENLPDGLPSLMLGGRRLYHVPTAMGWLERRERKPNPTRRRRAA